MKIASDHFIGAVRQGDSLPTHAVYNLATWKLLGESAKPLSLHFGFNSAMDSAVKHETLGSASVVVCFEDEPVRHGCPLNEY